MAIGRNVKASEPLVVQVGDHTRITIQHVSGDACEVQVVMRRERDKEFTLAVKGSLEAPVIGASRVVVKTNGKSRVSYTLTGGTERQMPLDL